MNEPDKLAYVKNYLRYQQVHVILVCIRQKKNKLMLDPALRIVSHNGDLTLLPHITQGSDSLTTSQTGI